MSSKPLINFSCEGKLHDTVLDWDDALPAYKFELSEKICKMSNLSLTIGTSLQVCSFIKTICL